MSRVAIIGAGISGLACARELTARGFDVVVFEKSRGPGGRMPTRWLERDNSPPVGFDHGTQYFQCSNPAFASVLDQALTAGAVAQWKGRVVDISYGVVQDHASPSARWVGTPGMASLAKFMSAGINVQLQSRVVDVIKKGNQYQLTIHKADGSAQVLHGFDAVVSAMPAEQVAQLYATAHGQLADLAAQVQSNVTWAVMLTLNEPLAVDYQGAFVVDNPLGWICLDSSKPGRAAGQRWLLQATADWSGNHQEYAAEDVAKMLTDVFSSVTGHVLDVGQAVAHRWLYSLPSNPLMVDFYLDEGERIGACGDWLAGARVEAAFASGHALGNRLCQVLDPAVSV